jgi:hypothetical protein
MVVSVWSVVHLNTAVGRESEKKSHRPPLAYTHGVIIKRAGRVGRPGAGRPRPHPTRASAVPARPRPQLRPTPRACACGP